MGINPKLVDLKLECQHNYHKGREALRIFALVRVGAFSVCVCENFASSGRYVLMKTIPWQQIFIMTTSNHNKARACSVHVLTCPGGHVTMKTLSASRTSVTSSGLGTECCAAEGPSTCHNDMERVSCDWWSDGHVTYTRPLIGAGGHTAAGLLQHLPQPGQPPAPRGGHLQQPVHAPQGLFHKYSKIQIQRYVNL